MRKGENSASYVVLIEYTMDCIQKAGNQGVAKTGFGWDGPGISLVDILKDFWHRIQDQEVESMRRQKREDVAVSSSNP